MWRKHLGSGGTAGTEPVGNTVRLTAPSLDDADDMPASEVLAAELVEDLQASQEGFAGIAEVLQRSKGDAEAELTPVAD